MSDRRPTSPFAGDDDPTPPRGNRRFGAGGRSRKRRLADDGAEGDDADRNDEEWDDEEWDEPNFLIRRALVVGSVVVVIALGAIVASRFIGGSDGESASSDDAEWDTTILLTANEIRLLDRESGDEIDTFESGVDLLDAQSLVAGDVLITMTDEGRISLIDLNDGTSRGGRSGTDETLRISPDNSAIALVGPDNGGDLTVIDTVGRSVFGVADVAGLDDPLIRADDMVVNPAGTHVAVPVPNAFQSFVIDVAEETSEPLAGRVIAISNDVVVTEQPAGAESEIEFHDLLGERLASADVAAPEATLLTEDGSLLAVAADGTMRTITSSGTVEDLDPLVDDEGVALTVSGGVALLDRSRLVVFTADQIVVLDTDGNRLGAVDGSMSQISAVGNRCITIGQGASTQPSSVVDLESGATIARFERGIPSTTSFDGCTVAVFGGASRQLLVDGEIVDVDADSVAAVAPDGDAYVVLDGRDTELVEVGNEDDPIEVADEPVVVHFGLRK